jgi:excisionase family DNA binding protein
LGRPLSTKEEGGEIFDADLYRAPVASAQMKADVPAKQELVIQEATTVEKERERGPGTLDDKTSETLSVNAAARIAGCSPDTVLRWIEEGAVEAWRHPPRGWYKVARDSLTRFLNRSAPNANAASA